MLCRVSENVHASGSSKELDKSSEILKYCSFSYNNLAEIKIVINSTWIDFSLEIIIRLGFRTHDIDTREVISGQIS